jgi:hypothetical protein
MNKQGEEPRTRKETHHWLVVHIVLNFVRIWISLTLCRFKVRRYAEAASKDLNCEVQVCWSRAMQFRCDFKFYRQFEISPELNYKSIFFQKNLKTSKNTKKYLKIIAQT